MSTQPLTHGLVQEHVHVPDLCSLVMSYAISIKRDWKSIAFVGEYETCMALPCACPEDDSWDSNEWNECLYGACKGGHLELAELAISKGATDFNLGLYGACAVGHLGLAELMISKGAEDFNRGLHGACHKGHFELATFMICKGATNFNHGLYGACYGGRLELAKFMIFKGAKDFGNGLAKACMSGHRELAELMIFEGAKNTEGTSTLDFNHASWCARDNGHLDLVKLLQMCKEADLG